MSATLKMPLIEGPSVWNGPDMAKREAEWTYVLTPTDVGEIENALAAVVPISARWTEADAIAGARPIAIRSVDEVRP